MRASTWSKALVSFAVVSAVTGCSLGLSPRPDAKDTADAPAKGGPSPFDQRASDPPRDLPGIDTSELADNRKQAFWDVASRLYAPCPKEAVSLVQCLEEKRACDACVPATNLLLQQVQRGAAKANAAAAVTARFAPESVRQVELGDSPSKGPADAPITIVVFSDFQCPACKATLPVLEQSVTKHRPHVRLVHKFYPLKKHLRARAAAYAAAAAQKQGKYWEMEHLIFQNQDALSDEDLERYAEKIGLDMVRFRDDRAATATQELVDRDIEAGDAAGLSHTPFVLVNGRLFDPAYFKYDRDLDPWIETEKELGAKAKQAAMTPPAPITPPATTTTTPAPPTQAE